MPRERSPQARSRTRAALSFQVSVFQAPSSGWRNAGTSGVVSTRARKRSGIERYGGGRTGSRVYARGRERRGNERGRPKRREKKIFLEGEEGNGAAQGRGGARSGAVP